jgi:hypothetical protein
MRRFIKLMTISTVTIVAIFAVATIALFPLPNRAFAAGGVDSNQCVPTAQNDCTTPSDSQTGADASASGSQGNDAGGSGGSVNNNAACDGLDQLGGTSCGNDAGQSAVGNVAARVVTIMSYVAGIIAIIMVVVSGIRYTTSGGDSAKVGAAKTALIYALIGIAVAALAQFLVHFVLSQASNA